LRDSLSTQFFTALPDILGILTDLVILEAFHQHLGLHIPVMTPFLHRHHFIVQHGHQAVVDQYRDTAEHANIRGGDWLRAHKKIKGTTGAFFRQTGFSTNIEPPNIFHHRRVRLNS